LNLFRINSACVPYMAYAIKTKFRAQGSVIFLFACRRREQGNAVRAYVDEGDGGKTQFSPTGRGRRWKGAAITAGEHSFPLQDGEALERRGNNGGRTQFSPTGRGERWKGAAITAGERSSPLQDGGNGGKTQFSPTGRGRRWKGEAITAGKQSSPLQDGGDGGKTQFSPTEWKAGKRENRLPARLPDILRLLCADYLSYSSAASLSSSMIGRFCGQ